MTDNNDGAETKERKGGVPPGGDPASKPEVAIRNLRQAPALDLPDIPRTPLQDKYEFLASIGAGGAGIIYKARQLPIGRLVAIKMIHSHLMTPTAVKRFQQEATTVGTLSHPNIIAVFDFGVSEGDQPFMVMDYIEGAPLSKILDDIGTLPSGMTISLAKQLCDGLCHAHARRILHRDLKPSNIMLVPIETGGPDLVKILDFGLAKMLYGEEDDEIRREHITKTGETVGTPAFMSPEQVMGKTLDHRTDIYSLGCVLYFCLTGRPPFAGQTRMETMLQQLNQKPEPLNTQETEPPVDPRLEELVLKLLEKNPADRFQTMTDVKEALEQIDEANPGASKVRAVPSRESSTGGDAPSQLEVLVSNPESNSEIATQISTPAPALQERTQTRSLFTTTTGFLFIVLLLVGISAGLVFLFQNLMESGSDEAKLSSSKKQTSLANKPERRQNEDSHKDQSFDNAAFEEALNDPNKEEASARLYLDITDEALSALERKENVHRVDLSNAKNITDKGIQHLSGLNIDQLSLDNTGVGDGIKDTLSTFRDKKGRSSLRELNLSGTRVSNQLLSILKDLPNLKKLNLSKTSISDKAGASDLANLNLVNLNVSDTRFGDTGAKSIGTIHSLVNLDLSNTKVSDKAITNLANLANLEQLNLSDTKVGDQAAPLLAKLPKLAVLNLSNTAITARCFSLLKSSDSLGFINISKCQAISPQQAVEFEHEMEQLKAVRVQVGEN